MPCTMVSHQPSHSISVVAQVFKLKRIKEKVEATHQEVVSILNSKLTQYKQHAYRVYHQQAKLDLMKSNLSQNECILIVDFSENWMQICI